MYDPLAVKALSILILLYSSQDKHHECMLRCSRDAHGTRTVIIVACQRGEFPIEFQYGESHCAPVNPTINRNQSTRAERRAKAKPLGPFSRSVASRIHFRACLKVHSITSITLHEEINRHISIIEISINFLQRSCDVIVAVYILLREDIII